jgi:hypothetical protein
MALKSYSGIFFSHKKGHIEFQEDILQLYQELIDFFLFVAVLIRILF